MSVHNNTDLVIVRTIELLKKRNKSQRELSDYLGITQNAVTDWKSGRLKSYRNYVYEIASFFDVPVSYLKGDTDTLDNITEINEAIIENQKSQIEIYKELLENHKKQIEIYKELLENRKKKIEICEKEIDIHKKENEYLQKRNDRLRTYLNISWILGFCASLLALIVCLVH